MIMLTNMQRKDFAEWLHDHFERALLKFIVHRINALVQAKLTTRFIKVPAHKRHTLNEAADASASAATAAADGETGALRHEDRRAVRFYVNNALTE